MIPANILLQNGYQIIRKIGQGGMGAVYEATDQRLGHTIALKQIVRGDPARFAQEAQLLARLRHPALAKVTDHFVDEVGQFLVMDYIPGDDLATLWLRRKGELTQNTVLDWGNQLLIVLDYLHRQTPSVIHRDIKPANLKVTAEEQLVLLGFGLAKGKIEESTEAPRAIANLPALSVPRRLPVTRPGSLLGTLRATLVPSKFAIALTIMRSRCLRDKGITLCLAILLMSHTSAFVVWHRYIDRCE